MRQEYEYDDSGLASSYLGLSILLPITAYLTYKRFMTGPATKKYLCTCEHCSISHSKPPKSINLFTIALLWTAISFLFRNILTLKLEYKSSYFNPYKVLGIDASSSMADIKRSFKKKVASLNPDMASESEREDATSRLKEIINAFNFLKENRNKVLASETTYEVVAIPKWIVDKGYLVLLIYAMVVGVYLPKWALGRWNSSILKNRLGVYYSTTDFFYKKIDYDIKDVRILVGFVTNSKDFQERRWKSRDLNFLKQAIEERFGFPLKEHKRCNKGYLVLMDHLFRTRKADPEDLEFVQVKSIAIVNSLKEIARRKNFQSFMNTLFMFERMIVQAVFDPDFYPMQVPGNCFEKVFLKNKKIKEAEIAVGSLPSIRIKNLRAFVEKTELLEDGSSVTEKNFYSVPVDSRVTVTFEVERSEDEFVHAPFLEKEAKLMWSILVAVDNRFLENMITVPNTSDQKEFKFVFDSAGNKSQSSVVVYVKTGEYFGVDQESSIILKYTK